MSDKKTNTRIWDALGKTDPKQTKPFSARPGGFKGTAIKPMWSYQRMTEHFGPCGVGWGPDKPHFEFVPAGEEIMVYCTVGMWYIDPNALPGEAGSLQWRGQVYGVGGDKVYIQSSKEGRDGNPRTTYRSSDEAYKAAYTDALTNAMKLIGVAADVHMGRFDDSKYVREVAEEFSNADNANESANGMVEPAAHSEDVPPYSKPEPAPVKRITKVQRDKFTAAVRASKKTFDEMKAYLAKNNFGSSGEITTDVYDTMMAWAKEEQ